MKILLIILLIFLVLLFIVYLDFRIAASRNYQWVDNKSSAFLQLKNKNYYQTLTAIKKDLFVYPHEDVFITTKDNIQLHGYFFNQQAKQTIICFHGYRYNCIKEYGLLAKTDLRKIDVASSLEDAILPTLFIHGTKDRLVPYEMSQINYEHCKAPKQLLLVDGADHGDSYMRDPQRYMKTLLTFIEDLKECDN